MSKFDSEKAERLYDEAAQGFADDEIGSVQELGWAGLFKSELAYIVEDSQGFVWIEEFDTEADVEAAWKEIEDTYEEYDYLGLLA